MAVEGLFEHTCEASQPRMTPAWHLVPILDLRQRFLPARWQINRRSLHIYTLAAVLQVGGEYPKGYMHEKCKKGEVMTQIAHLQL